MEEYLIAVTYDICEHIELIEDVNEYPLESSIDIERQGRRFVELDVASLEKVYKSETNDFKELIFESIS